MQLRCISAAIGHRNRDTVSRKDKMCPVTVMLRLTGKRHLDPIDDGLDKSWMIKKLPDLLDGRCSRTNLSSRAFDVFSILAAAGIRAEC